MPIAGVDRMMDNQFIETKAKFGMARLVRAEWLGK